MSLPLFLQGLGSIGIFATRAFLPAFMTAWLLRFGPEIPWLAHAGLVPHVRDVPTWFTSNASLVILGILSALELLAERSPEAKIVLDVHGYLKAGMAALTHLGVMNTTDRAVAEPLIHHAGFFDFVPAMVVGAGTFFATQFGALILSPLTEADEDDDLGIQRTFAYVGDLCGLLGPIVLIVFPILTIACFCIAVVIVVWLERRIETRAGRTLTPCRACGQSIHVCAIVCPSCGTPTEAPRAISLLGQPSDQPAKIGSLGFSLIAVKRCPRCATRFSGRSVKPVCLTCGHRQSIDPPSPREYVAFIDRRVPLVCVAGFLLGLIPILGVIPGVIYYRLAIVAPYRRYMPVAHGFFLRWGIRLAVVLLVAFQWVPVAGGLAIPCMALINYSAYRTVYRSLTNSEMVARR